MALPLLILLLLAQAVPDKEADAALSQFRKDYKSTDKDKRFEAVTALGRVQHPKVLAMLSPIVAREETEIRWAAIEGLAAWKIKQPEIIQVLCASFKVEVRAQQSEMPYDPFLEAFGKLRAKAALPDIHYVLQSWEADWLTRAIKSTGEIRSRDSIDPLVKLWQRDETQAKDQNVLNDKVRPQLNAEIAARLPEIKVALKSITGQDFAGPAEVLKWWKDNKATFKDP